MKTTLKVLALFAFLSILGYLTFKGYDQCWTGFQGYTNNKGDVIPPKKLWDWLQLLIVPILLAIAVWWLNKTQKKSELQIENDRQRQKSLEDYFNCITELLLKEHLRDQSNNNEACKIARTRTLSVLRILDGNRKAQVLQFIYEAGLINKNPIIRMNGADMIGASLNCASLQEAELRGAYFTNAQLRGANLANADLRGSDFSSADLTEASMNHSNLTQAIFKKAQLSNADMKNTNLTQAIFEKAKLHNADLTDANLEFADLSHADLKNAKLPTL